MAYVALYRKWRPKDFAGLIGQDHISKTLANAIVSGRIGHAYLFAGPRGTGKTSTAKIFAKALNCQEGPTPTPCNVCSCCQKINEGSSMDVFEIDAASNRGIDEIRELRETVKFAPVDGRYKVYIIDEVHMLTTEAFNALLKTLEEPPAHVVFILATTEAHKVPATIQSRCQRYDFKRITSREIELRLREVADKSQMQATDESLHIIAVHADGGMRDALSILDQCASLSDGTMDADTVRKILGIVGNTWIWKLTDALLAHDTMELLSITDELLSGGKSVKQILTEWVLHLRSLMIYQAVGRPEGIELYSEDEDVLSRQTKQAEHAEIVQWIQKLHLASSEIKWSPQPRIVLEVAMLSLCYRVDTPIGEGDPRVYENTDVRIRQMEGQIADLRAKIDQLQALPQPGVAASPLPPENPKAAVRERMGIAVQRQEVPPARIPTEISEDGQNVWGKVLETLKKQGKMPVLACVKSGEVRGMNDGQFFILFKSSFMKARTEKEDYRVLLEGILQQICGHPMRLVCSLAAAEPPPAPPVKEQTKKTAPEPVVAVDYQQMTEQEQHTLKKAVEIFGDHFVPVEDK